MDRLIRPREMITMAIVMRKAVGLAEFYTSTPTGVATSPPMTRPMLARSFK